MTPIAGMKDTIHLNMCKSNRKEEGMVLYANVLAQKTK